MNILITNDDGIDAPGIQALISALLTCGSPHTLYVVAPHEGMSAMGHAITLKGGVLAIPTQVPGCELAYRIKGTPADCVKVALLYLLADVQIDLVLSGINNGGNIGTEVVYSGTFAAAHEAHRLGYPTMAISLINAFPNRLDLQVGHFEGPARHIAGLTSSLHAHYFENDAPYFFNVNYPSGLGDIVLRVAQPADVRYQELVHIEPEQCNLATGGQAMRIFFDGLAVDWSAEANTDFKLLQQGIATIVPIHLQWSKAEAIDELRNKLTQI